MKFCLIFLLLFSFAGCGGEQPKPEAAIPADADLRVDMMIQGSGKDRTVEFTFFYTHSVPPGDKSAPTVDVIAVDEARVNDTPMTASSNAVGRTVYTAEESALKLENTISAKVNGRQYEGKVRALTTLPNRSATAVLSPK